LLLLCASACSTKREKPIAHSANWSSILQWKDFSTAYQNQPEYEKYWQGDYEYLHIFF